MRAKPSMIFKDFMDEGWNFYIIPKELQTMHASDAY